MMTVLPPRRSRRSLLTSIALAVVLVVVALVFHRPLIAWFSGQSMGVTGAPVTVHAGIFSLKASLDPDPPAMKGNVLMLEIQDVSGKAVDDAKVEVVYDMPAMGAMSEMKGTADVKHEKNGRYRAAFDLPMGGTWPLSVSIQAPSGSASQTFKLTVGSKGLSASGGAGGAMSSMTGMAAGGAMAAPVVSAAPGEIDHYTCSMHPSVKQASPGKCPLCGMDLIPVTKAQQEQGVVMIDEARRQLIGVRTARVIEGPMRDTFRAVGRVAYDESALADVNLKVRGWITQLSVSKTGQRVARGQTLFTMYSPELYNAQQDFLLATHGAVAAAMGATDAGSPRGESLGRAARQRLRLLGMEDAQIDAVARKGEPLESIAVPSPASGFVIEKNVVEGASVDAGTRLYRIAALDKVWIEAEVYEADLARVRVGQPVKVTLDYVPGHIYDAKVGYVYPYLESKARTGRVRVEIRNKELELRPGMYANVELGSDLGNRVQVPAPAVVYTGPRRLVFVDLGEGRFKPQEIQVGTEAGGMFEVRSGLEAGDLVATSGVFLIAAEARISTAAKYWESSTEADGAAPTSNAPAAIIYSCPMHPEVQSQSPGKCPKCGMDLQPPMGGKP